LTEFAWRKNIDCLWLGGKILTVFDWEIKIKFTQNTTRNLNIFSCKPIQSIFSCKPIQSIFSCKPIQSIFSCKPIQSIFFLPVKDSQYFSSQPKTVNIFPPSKFSQYFPSKPILTELACKKICLDFLLCFV
jgi:hypothetical protein